MEVSSRNEDTDFEKEASPLNFYIWKHIPGLVFIIGGIEQFGVLAHNLTAAQDGLHTFLQQTGLNITRETVGRLPYRIAGDMEAFYIATKFGGI